MDAALIKIKHHWGLDQLVHVACKIVQDRSTIHQIKKYALSSAQYYSSMELDFLFLICSFYASRTN